MLSYNCYRILFCFFVFCTPFISNGQTLSMGAVLGIRNNIQNNSSGLVQSIFLSKKCSKKISVKMGVGLSVAESQSAVYKSDATNTLIRNRNQPVPVGVLNNFWDIDAFPRFDVKDNGNRYADLYSYLLGNYNMCNKNRNNIVVGVGAGLHRKDESEQIGSIIAEETYWIFGGQTTFDTDIPIFAYNTFLDLSFIIEASYVLKIRERIDLFYESTVFFYPKSNRLSLNNSFGVCVRL